MIFLSFDALRVFEYCLKKTTSFTQNLEKNCSNFFLQGEASPLFKKQVAILTLITSSLLFLFLFYRNTSTAPCSTPTLPACDSSSVDDDDNTTGNSSFYGYFEENMSDFGDNIVICTSTPNPSPKKESKN